LEGKKWSRSVSATSAGSEAPGKSGNLCGGRPNVNLLAIQRERGVAEDRKSDQCVRLAEAMPLKYVLLELFILLQFRGDGSSGISLQTCDTPFSGTIGGGGTTMVSSGGTGACSGHGRLGGR